MSWSGGLASKPKWPLFTLLLLPQDRQLLSGLMGSAFMRKGLLGEGLLAPNRASLLVGLEGLMHSGILAFCVM